jgi:hypothetical protein
VYACGFAFLKNVKHKILLQKRFAAGKGNSASATLKVSAETLYFSKNLIARNLLPDSAAPAFGVMAKCTTKRAALHKDNSPYTGSVNKTHTFKR